jgi:hypothetical protein
MTIPKSVRLGAPILVLALSTIAAAETNSFDGRNHEAASPKPAVSPAAKKEHDAATGADEVGIGRSVGAVKSSGDDGGTAAGMPGKGPEKPRQGR